jgi:hypothetical protein
VPGVNDDVTISVPANPTIQITSGIQAIHSLLSDEAINISGGTLAVTTTIGISQNVTLSGGKLQGGTVTAMGGAKLVFPSNGGFVGGTLDGVTANCNLDLTSSNVYEVWLTG